MRIFRLIKIMFIFYRYGLFQIMQDYKKTSILSNSLYLLFIWVPIKNKNDPLPVRLRIAFEKLGPVFVKLGQLLSTRPDILPEDYIIELSKLQNQVPPFKSQLAINTIEKSLNKKYSIRIVSIPFIKYLNRSPRNNLKVSNSGKILFFVSP